MNLFSIYFQLSIIPSSSQNSLDEKKLNVNTCISCMSINKSGLWLLVFGLWSSHIILALTSFHARTHTQFVGTL